MVCLGNICRSPTAEAVLRAQANLRGLGALVEVDSAGTSDWHTGESPDARSIQAAAVRGYELAALKGRQVAHEDFLRFDYILAMDKSNLSSLRGLCPQEYQGKLLLLLSHGSGEHQEVPDPYYSGADGFELVLDLIEESCQSFLDLLQDRHRLG